MSSATLKSLVHTRLRKIRRAGNSSSQQPRILMDLPLTLYLLHVHGLRLKLHPLTPAAALPEGASSYKTVQQDPRLSDLTTGCLFE